MSKNYYSVLGLPQNSTARQVKARFLELARERHPDRFRGEEKAEAEERFQEITEAFNALSDPERRRQLDAELARASTASAQAQKGGAAKVYMQRGIRAFRDENYLEAAENFDRVTQEDPKNARAWHYLALACSKQRRWLVRARNAVIRAAELEPMNASYLELAGRLCHESGLASKAEKYLAEALEWGGPDEAIEALLDDVRKGRKSAKSGFFSRSS